MFRSFASDGATGTNPAYAWTGQGDSSTTYGINGLNQVTGNGGIATDHDDNGNLTDDGPTTYSYDSENRLVSASNGTTLGYDPLGRLSQVSKAGVTTRFLHDELR